MMNRPICFFLHPTTRLCHSRFATVYAAWHDLRQQLMTDVVERGWPLVRPLFLHFGADAATWTIGLQYLIGEEMMVAPVVTQGAVSVRVYFLIGAGPWTAVFDPAKTVYATPGWVEVDAPIGRPAVFVRTGSTTGARFVRTLRERGVIE